MVILIAIHQVWATYVADIIRKEQQMTLDFRSVLPQNYMSLCGVKSQPVQGRHMVSARSALRPRSSKIFLVELANFSSLSAEGLSTTTSPARSGCGDIGLKLGITPISASFFTPAKTHSSLSPRPSMSWKRPCSCRRSSRLPSGN